MRLLAAGAFVPLLAFGAPMLRYENISDIEVREIQTAVAGLTPGAIINIDSVFEGCSCEEGPTCTDQVWVVSHLPSQTVSLKLSRMDGHWKLGPFEEWQRTWDAFQKRRWELLILPRDKDYASRRNAMTEEQGMLLAQKPKCDAPKDAFRNFVPFTQSSGG
jgi:hypothetical protein